MLNAVGGTFFVDSGVISLGGVNITNWPEYRRAKLIGRVFQNPFSGTAPDMSVAENLALAARRGRPRRLGWLIGRHRRAELRERVSQLKMGLENRLDDPIGCSLGRSTTSVDTVDGNLAEARITLTR